MEQERAKEGDIGREILDDLKKNPIVIFFDRVFENTHHKYFLPIASFFDGILVILPLEAVAVGYTLKHKNVNPLTMGILSGITSTLGALLIYYIGLLFFPVLDGWLSISSGEVFSVFKNTFIDNQILLVVSSAFFSTIPFTPLCLLSGFFGVNIYIFIFGTLIARGFRLCLIMFLTKKMGLRVIEKFFTNFAFFSIIITLLIVYFVFFR